MTIVYKPNESSIKQAINYPSLTTLTQSILAVSLLMSGGAYASEYSSVTFFGDSLTDGGYFKPLTEAKGLEDAGQFTTNPDSSWAKPFAENLGLTSIANTVDGSQKGNNYAIGGARSGIDVQRQGMQIDAASTQLESYLTNHSVDPEGLYSVWIGANDLLAVVSDIGNADSIISAAADSHVDVISKLNQQGAKYIIVPNLPDVGLTPYLASSGEALQAFGTNLSRQYNDTLYNGIKQSAIPIIPLDSFSLLQLVSSDPATYGFSNISEKACGDVDSLECGRDDLVEPNANNTYFFADSIHPTGRAHRMIADYASAVVTAPTQIGMLPHIATQSALATNRRLQTHTNQLQDNAPTQRNSGPSIWASADVNAIDVAGFKSSGNNQLLLGVDFAHEDSSAVTGIYTNITQTEFDNEVRSGVNEVDFDEIGLGIYHTNYLGKVQLQSAIGYGNIDMEVNRQVSLDNYQQDFKSDADGKRYFASLQVGYPISFSNDQSQSQLATTRFTPYLEATVNRVQLEGLTEKEADNPLAMQFDDQDYNTVYGTVGIKANHKVANNLDVFGDMFYQKQLDDDRNNVTARLNTLSDIPFNTPVSDIDEDSFGVTLGVSRKFGTIDTNAGVTYLAGDDENTSVFVGLSRSF